MASLMLASAALKEVLGKFVSLRWKELGVLRELKEDLEDMDHTLSTLQAVLQDAEKRSVKNEALRLWLDNLKDAAYDIDDILDDFLVKESQHREQDDLFSQVRQNTPFKPRVTMARKMKNMREKLNRIAEKRSKFHLKEEISLGKQEIVKERETFSKTYIDESQVYGREQEKETIVKFLLDRNRKEDVSVFAIVGMGGLGKTTLAQAVYNDEDVQNRFDLRAWVYVSTEFDLNKIVRDVISATGCKSDFDNLESTMICLWETLLAKRYLIVLDDVHEDMHAWNELKLMLRAGARGSKIIVTTRSQRVAKMMATTEPLHLKPLSEENCWKLFRQRAFGSDDEEHKYQILVKIGKEIAKRCGGVPLAANALGNMMRFKRSENIWMALKDSESWDLHEGENLGDNVIFSSLKLSYFHMPFELQVCFSYCSIFPKGYEIDKDKLIQQWIALGFIKATQQNMSELVDIGQKYIDDLRDLSFLQDFKEHEKPRRVTCKMHDLVHDLAQYVGASEFLITNDSKEVYKDVRSPIYLSLVGYEDPSKIYAVVSKKVRALHFKMCGFKKLPTQLFSWTDNVRVLDISGCSIEELPISISKLQQLRYLDASGAPLHTLPELTCDHPNLQMLDLSGSLLETIPKTIGRLHQLRVLNLSECSLLLTLPVSIGKLQFFQHLDLSSCYNLKSLPESIGNLQLLQHLYLSNCYKLKSIPESIGKLQCLQYLDLSSCQKLQSLPESIGNLQSLQYFDLSGCCTLKLLSDSIGNLQSLQHLVLSYLDFDSLPKSIGKLQSLQYLDLGWCGDLKSLPESIGNLQNLQHLDLSRCGELKSLPTSIGNLRNLQHLDLGWCGELKSLPKFIGKIQSLQHLKLSNCLQLQELPEGIGNLVNLISLDLSWCKALKKLPQSISKLVNLKKLNLTECDLLEEVPTGLGTMSSILFVDNNYGDEIQPRSDQLESKLTVETDESYEDISIQELQYLSSSSVSLAINGLQNVKDPADAANARLREKEKLMSLTLTWSCVDDDERCNWDEVLEQLQPPSNLRFLELHGYLGHRFPDWMTNTMQLLLPNLLEIKLTGIHKLEKLPPLGQLPHLKELELSHMDTIRTIGVEFYGHYQVQVVFPSLEELYLCDMRNLEEWLVVEFPCLWCLKIEACPHLRPRPCIPAVVYLHLSGSDEILSSWDSMEPLSSSSSSSSIGHAKLEELYIVGCQKLTKLPESMRHFQSLRSLRIQDCSNLVALPEWLGHLSSLKELEIQGCVALDSPPPRSVQRLLV